MSKNRVINRKTKTSQRKFLQHLVAYRKELKEIDLWVESLMKDISKERIESKEGCENCNSFDLRHRVNGGYFCKKCGFNYEPKLNKRMIRK